jgi:hypothetical protein
VAIKIVDKKLMAEKVQKSSKRKEKMRAQTKTNCVKVNSANPSTSHSKGKGDDDPLILDQRSSQHTGATVSGAAKLSKDGCSPDCTSATFERDEVSSDKATSNSEDNIPDPSPLTKEDSVPVISPISSPLPDPNTSTSLIDSLYAEVRLLMRLNHPNIIGLYQVIDTDDECFIVM